MCGSCRVTLKLHGAVALVVSAVVVTVVVTVPEATLVALVVDAAGCRGFYAKCW